MFYNRRDSIIEAVKPSDLRYKFLRDLSSKFEVKGLSSAAHLRELTINGISADTGGGSSGVELTLNPKDSKQKRDAKEIIVFAKKWFKKYKFKNDSQKSRIHRANVWMNDDWNLGVMFGKSRPQIAIKKGSWF